MNYPTANNMPPLQFLSPLHKAMRLIGDHLTTRLARTGLSSTEAHLLSYLRSYGPCPIGAVVLVFGLKKSTLTGVTDRLVEKGLLDRTVNPRDRRSFVLNLTEAGRDQADQVRTALDGFERNVAAQLSEADLQGFRNVMNAIARVTTPDDQGAPRP